MIRKNHDVDKKLEAAAKMEKIRTSRVRLDVIVQWVHAVYKNELKYFDEDAVRNQNDEEN